MAHRTMYDSTDPRLFPADADVIAYYPYAWGTDLSRVHSAIEVRIVNMNDGKLHADDCHAIDVENGAASIQDAVNFVDMWHSMHAGGMHTANGWIRKPIVYISEARVPALRNALAGRDFDLWVAWWGIGPTDVPGAFAHQYTNRGPNGENYDISVVSDDMWGLPPAPPAPPQPPAGQTYQGVIVYSVAGRLASKAVTSTDSGVHWS